LSKISFGNIYATLSGLYAALAGSSTQKFDVADATTATNALNRRTGDGRYPQIVNIASLAGFLQENSYSLVWNNATRELTVTPVTASFSFYSNNVLYTKSAPETIGIPNATGSYYFYYDPTGALSVATSFNNNFILIYSFVSSVYWNATLGLAVPDALIEGHTALMPAQTHLYLHSTIGTAYDQEIGGLLPTVTIGDGSLDTHVQFSATPGAIWDDDVQRIIPVKLLADNIPVLFKTGASSIWNFDETSSAMVRTTGSGRAGYNQFTGGAWQVTECTDGYYMLMHLFAIPGVTKRWMFIMGVNEYADINAATAAAKTEITTVTGIPFAEHKDIATFIIKTDNTFTNAYKSAVAQLATGEDFFDWRFSEIGGAGASGTGGDVVGPVGATDGNIAVFDGATGILLKDGGTPTAIIGTAINGATNKATPVDADKFGFFDSVGSVLKQATWANIKTTLGSLFAPINNPTLTGTTAAPTPTAGDSSTKIATTAFVATSFAPLDSPTFLNNPRAPTVSQHDNSTQIATTAYVDAGLTASAPFPTGTRMSFNQTTAPTGWTKDTTAALNDTAMRIVTGTVGSGGVQAFSAVFARTSSDGYTLQIADIPSHTHAQDPNTVVYSTGSSNGALNAGPYARGSSTGAAGGSGAHAHGMDIRVKYNDFIIATKN
jgi:hypothetical protein